MSKLLHVSAIEKGTVIDHIPAGYGMNIVQLLSLQSLPYKVTLGLNLPSEKLGKKDIVKVEGYTCPEESLSVISVFAPGGRVNFVENFEVIRKVTLTLPNHVEGIFSCLNPRCITHAEGDKTDYQTSTFRRKTVMQCAYCDHVFPFDKVRENI